jgi:type IV pilus assembly protein PilM
MAEARAAWGIDIGQSALKALKLRYFEDAGQAVAVAFDYIPYPKILSQPDAIPDEIIGQAMQTFLSRNEVQGDLIAISVPGQSALARFIQLPPVETSKLAEIIKYEARQQIPFALEEVIWDYQPLGAGAEESGYLLDAEVGLFAMKRDQVQQQLKPFNQAKLEVELIQIAPLTLYNVLTYDELGIRPGKDAPADDEYIIVLDMGCDNTALLVSNGKKIWVRNVPLGGNHFTRALTKEMKLSFAKAEHLKCNATKSPDPRAVFQALRPVFNDYAAEIQRSIGFFSSVNRQAKIAKVIGVGNGFKLAGLQKFLQQNLQYEVERPDTYKALAGDAVLNAPLFADNVLSFAVSYGLALQVLGQTTIRTSLLPPEIITSRKIRKKKPWAVATAACLLFGYALSTMGNANSYAKPHSDEFAQAEEKAKQLNTTVTGYETAYNGEKGKFEATKNELDSLIAGRRDLTWLDAYNAVIDCLPRDEGDEQDVTDIEKRELISITSFTAEKQADVGKWYSTLSKAGQNDQTYYMLQEDKDKAPSGEGYIVTLTGQHWHYGDDAQDRGLSYVVNKFLRNLQKQTVDTPDCPPRDVRRMGITHPTITDKQESLVVYDPLGVMKATTGTSGYPMQSNPGLATFAPTAVPRAATVPGQALPEEVRQIKQFDFKIQFVFQPIARDKRAEIVVEAPPEEPAVETNALDPGTTPAPAEAAPETTPAPE